ncbi:MAG: hypothetical protein L6R35_007468, partial [Caloplaca aegaea]
GHCARDNCQFRHYSALEGIPIAPDVEEHQVRRVPIEGNQPAGGGGFTAFVEPVNKDEARQSSAASAISKAMRRGIDYWIVDTGAGSDIIGRNLIRKSWLPHVTDMDTTYRVSTANGVTEVDKKMDLYVPVLREVVQPMVMDENPPLMSVGKRCMEHDYEFHWYPKQAPYFISPDKETITLEVENSVPLLRSLGTVPWPGRDDNTMPDKLGCPTCSMEFTTTKSFLAHVVSRAHQRETSQLPDCHEVAPQEPEVQVAVAKSQAQPSIGIGATSEPRPVADGDEEATAWPAPHDLEEVKCSNRRKEQIFHECAHVPKRADCSSCIKCKAQRRPCRRQQQPFAELPFGRAMTADITEIVGLTDDDRRQATPRYALIFLDRGTKWIDVAALHDRESDGVRLALQDIVGPDVRPGVLYTDCAPEFTVAAK